MMIKTMKKIIRNIRCAKGDLTIPDVKLDFTGGQVLSNCRASSAE
jgi:hypothetical protein